MHAPLTPDDLPRFAVPTSFTLSPDGSRLIYSLMTQDAEADTRRAALWMIHLAKPDLPARQFTNGKHRDRSPQWSPDGAWLAFISDREDGSQIWLMPADGGEARRVTAMRHGASHPRWSPDGKSLLFLAEARPGEDPLIGGKEDRTAREKREATRLRHVTRIQYRWDGEDIREGRTHIWRVDVAEIVAHLPDAQMPLPVMMTSGDYDHADPAWSPDGRAIVFVSDRADERDANRTDDVWVMDVASGEMSRITTIPSENHHPVWSPDGRCVAWYGGEVIPDASYSNQHLWVAQREHGDWQARDVLAGQDVLLGQGMLGDIAWLSGGEPAWCADGETLYVTIHERGVTNLARVALHNGSLTRITQGPWQLSQPAVLADQSAVIAIAATPERPADIARFDLCQVTEPRWLTETNAWLSERAISLPQEFTYTTSDGWHLQGWVIPPVGAEEAPPDHRWPAVLKIHGGPHGSYGPTFQAANQIFAGAGYAVIYVNPRGSMGYGEVFGRACDRDWGGADFRDIMQGLDAAIARGEIDPDWLAVTGVSYGGYMTNWIIGHTDRFKAAVTINSVSNLISSFGTSDVDAVFGVVEQGGTPWNRLEWYIERSPITYADRVTTPTRVIGAERDWRCPIEQSEQMFMALAYFHRAPVDFFRVPGVSHAIRTGTPCQFVAYTHAVLEWIERYNPAS